MALCNSRHIHSLDPAERLATLSEISRVVSSTLDLYSLYETIYQEVSALMDTTQFFIALDCPARGVVELPYLRESGKLYRDEERPQGDSVTSLVIDGGMPLFFSSHADYQRYVRDVGLRELTVGQDPSEAKLWVPLNTGNKTIGAMSIQSSYRDAYSEDDIKMLSIIATQAAVAIENAHLFAELQARIDQLLQLERALWESQNRYRSVIEASADAIVLCNLEGTITMVNPSCVHLLNLSTREDLIGSSIYDVIDPRDRERARENLGRRQNGLLPPEVASEYRLCKVTGEGFIAEVHSSVLRDDVGEPSGLTIVARDVTERKRLEQELKYQAFHDALTGLANRALFEDRFQQAIERAQRTGESFALLLMDLDRFKEVNDVFGHHWGDVLLKEVGRRLQQGLRAVDTVARLGGDEFAVLLPATDEQGAVAAASAIASELEQPFTFEEHSLDVGTSVGIVVYPQHGDKLDALLRHADAAMYAAKRTNSRRIVYRHGQEPYTRRLHTDRRVS